MESVSACSGVLEGKHKARDVAKLRHLFYIPPFLTYLCLVFVLRKQYVINRIMAKKNIKSARKQNPGTMPAPVSLWKRLKSGELKSSLEEYLKVETLRFSVGFCLLLFSVFLLISFVSNLFTGHIDLSGIEGGCLQHAANYGGKWGAYLSHYFMDSCFGLLSVFIPLILLLVGVKLMGAYRVRLWKWFLNFSIIMIWGSVFLSLWTPHLPESWRELFSFRLGGGHGDYIGGILSANLGELGAWVVVIATAVFYLMYLSGETVRIVRRMLRPQDFIKNKAALKEALNDAKNSEDERPQPTDSEENINDDVVKEKDSDRSFADTTEEMPVSEGNEQDDADKDLSFEISSNDEKEEKAEETVQDTDLDIVKTEEEDEADGKTVEEVRELEPYDPRKDLENYKFPVISLLKHYEDTGSTINMDEQNANKERIITVLRNFGVEISGIKATIGPTITLYEVTPAPGVRINKIRNLEDDIALSLSALGIRIIAPIPGKGTIGIEVPNKQPRIVSMESIINTKKFQESTFELPIALGKTITNEVFMVDLAKMPHLLVAGATGQGKSVGLNAIITSLLYKKHPAELKFVMVDPKKVEFSIYAPIERHFLAKIPDDAEDPIITDVTKVVQTLKSLCQLMDHRYDLLKKAKVRNIKEYNAKFKARQLNPENGHEFMPYIVIIIDEFGDLIMTAGKEVELPIARIAQLARAVGMHMVIATQRPTTNIITGTIKANFPARMAFKVMAQIDSRTILDQSGANQLVGKGDMLFLAGNTPTRVQCAFVDTPEVERINDFISEQQGYLSAFELPEPEMDGESGGSGADLSNETLDPMFEEAARLIVVHQQGSTSLIQRKFSIGYNRAGRLMDQLERAGVVGPVRGSKPREVLISDEVELDAKLQTLR